MIFFSKPRDLGFLKEYPLPKLKVICKAFELKYKHFRKVKKCLIPAENLIAYERSYYAKIMNYAILCRLQR